jgi:hypothetical protein
MLTGSSSAEPPCRVHLGIGETWAARTLSVRYVTDGRRLSGATCLLREQEDNMDYTNLVIDDPLPSSYPGTEIVLG